MLGYALTIAVLGALGAPHLADLQGGTHGDARAHWSFLIIRFCMGITQGLKLATKGSAVVADIKAFDLQPDLRARRVVAHIAIYTYMRLLPSKIFSRVWWLHLQLSHCYTATPTGLERTASTFRGSHA